LRQIADWGVRRKVGNGVVGSLLAGKDAKGWLGKGWTRDVGKDDEKVCYESRS
jgi:hypothetical protein